ncbi:DMT family protein [Tessaracoccus sp. Y36]
MIYLAIAMQVCGSFLFASGAILQSLGVKSLFDADAVTSSNRLSLKGLLKLFTVPKWVIGLGLVFAGAAIHLTALTFAPVSVVQPVGILAVPWSVLLASKIHKHKINARLWGAVGVTVLGVVGFTVFSSQYATGEKQFSFPAMLWSFVVVCVLCAALSFFATRAVAWAKAILWSSVGAIFYGLASGFMKAAMNLIQKHDQSFGSWQFLATAAMMLLCYILGAWMIQQGYASGPAEITVGTMTTVDPFVAVVFGLVVLGEGIGMGAGPVLGMIVTGAIAVSGVALLSKDHPDAVEERLRAQADFSPSPAER